MKTWVFHDAKGWLEMTHGRSELADVHDADMQLWHKKDRE
jgi:hypothetical protein